jgi:hypothetical protein
MSIDTIIKEKIYKEKQQRLLLGKSLIDAVGRRYVSWTRRPLSAIKPRINNNKQQTTTTTTTTTTRIIYLLNKRKKQTSADDDLKNIIASSLSTIYHHTCLKVIQNQQGQQNQNVIIRSLKRRKKEKKNEYLIDGRHLHGMRGCFRELQFYFFCRRLIRTKCNKTASLSERARSSSSGKVICFLRSRSKICATREEEAAAVARAKPAR